MAARSLEFLILTAGRTGEVLGARWREIDLDAKVWTVPPERMKMRVEHRVPLTDPAITILDAMKVFGCKPDDYVFPGERADDNGEAKPLSNMVMAMLLRRMKLDQYTPHGFRSTFRDWAGEVTDFPREVAEAALAQAVGDEVERAYRRGDALAKRRKLMEAWAEYVMSKV
jgi:integrase